MKFNIRKMTDVEGNDVLIPFVKEKYDEFYIISKSGIKSIMRAKSIQTIKYFFLIITYLMYNDDRLRLSSQQKKDINEKMGIDRQRAWKITKELLELGLLAPTDADGEYKIPASIAWYGDKQTKRNLIKSYSQKTIKPNENF